MTKIWRWSMPRGAHTHVTSLLQTLKWLSSHSETTLGYARSHESPHDSIHSSDASLLALSNTLEHIPQPLCTCCSLSRMLYHFFRSFFKLLFQGTFPGSLSKIQPLAAISYSPPLHTALSKSLPVLFISCLPY